VKNIYKRALVNTVLYSINYTIVVYFAWSWCLNLEFDLWKAVVVGIIQSWSFAFFSVISDRINGVKKHD